MEYQPKTPGDGLKPPKARAFKEFLTKKGVVIGVFQGRRGANSDLDIIVKYREAGKRVRTPQHLHWAIDLLIKKEHNRTLTLEFVKFLLGMWDKTEPFGNQTQQQECELKVSTKHNIEQFEKLDSYGEYSVEFIAKVLELIMIQEKTGLAKAFMFRNLLQAIYDEKDIFSIVSSAGYRGKRA
ncbi:TPA: hypothetical protein HA318_04255 [Candidatus Micrarchaeota archaeon]|nr:MAG: hypothetical protein AUJ65_01755 [Candidatus Micrarchaeota archaeon CG1_02_51_15]HII39184.1 hypothetical protein [Candidatus Micrarchaeota archaeon]